jgi:hypothetical protein
MENILHLSPEEIGKIDIILLPYKRLPSRIDKNLDHFLTKWRDFVKQVEDGYKLPVDDYANELTRRDILQKIIDGSQPETGEKIINWLAEWDDRLVKVTKEIKEPLLPPIDDRKQGWWWYRIPIKPAGYLDEWLAVED